MASRVLMPKGSDTMTEGKVLKWLKNEGEQVANGDPLVEIETDKVDMEVESMASGVLRKVLVKAGETVPVGQMLAVIGKAEEDISSLISSNGGAAAARPAAPPEMKEPEPKEPESSKPEARAEAPAPGAAPAPQAAQGGRVLASPLARRIARDAGVDLASIQGSGPGGRIIRRDVESATAAGAPSRAAALQFAPQGPEFRDEPLSQMRKTIAQRLAQSLGPVPHFYLTIDVNMKKARELRESANKLNPDLKLTYNDIIVKGCAVALTQHPDVNASYTGNAIRYHNRIHLGIAVAIEGGGLITPVVRDCNLKTLQQISSESKDLIARARTRKLKPEEYTGGTFSVSNLGMMGIVEFSAIINPPEGAILAIGSVEEKPVVEDGKIKIGYRCRMTLSCDHRVVDGATGAKFLQTLQQILENPLLLAL
ncbi:MAG TPA: pyruvate dehydrogenase complex dihydrolipoamide acetyltransferase [Terriglobia bacterium]|nr:pyruvate dehydrogenase complex dihydrolipoamide acetyltransferase [Terriglobia bacterium]